MTSDTLYTKSHIDSSLVDNQLDIAAKVREINSKRPELNGKSPKFYIQTLGCQQNEADSERIAGLCVMMGYEMTYNP